MAERVPIAHFADPQTADLAAEFLEIQGLDAVALEKTSIRAAGGGVVLVPRKEAVSAVALLHRVRRGDFAEPHHDLRADEAETMTLLTQSLRGSGARFSWRHHLPILVTGTVVVLGIAGLLIVAAILEL